MKEKLFQLFFCIYIFWESILCTVLGNEGVSMESGYMKMTLAVIFAASAFFYVSFRFLKFDKRVLLVTAIFGLLFYSTQYFYGIRNSGYWGQFLRWGSDCVSAVLIGLTLMKQKNYNTIHFILPWECLALTPFLAQSVLANATTAQMHIEGGFNYQTMAYACAVLFCFSFYYAFVYSGKKNFIVRLIMMGAMLVQAVTCALAGGRGGLVLLIVYIVYMTYCLFRRSNLSKIRLFAIAVVAIVGFIMVANQFNLWDSAGFSRSSNFAHNDDRFELWRAIWPFVSDSAYMGYGIGGDYYSWGFYTHNILLDWLLELGLFGAVVMIVFYFKQIQKLWRIAKTNEIFSVLMILFLFAFVMNLFSGYWITTSANWLVFGAVFSISKLENLNC